MLTFTAADPDGNTSPPAAIPYTIGEPPTYDRVIVAGEHFATETVIPAGETWYAAVPFTASKNLIVEGTLVGRPGCRLTFTGIVENNMVGGGLVPLPTDIGLWVINAGRLDLQGTPKVGWNRIGTDPSWLPNDEVLRAPNTPNVFTMQPYVQGTPLTRYHELVPVTEVVNLTRDVVIGGTATGRSHVFIRNTVPTQHTIRYVRFEHVGPKKANGLGVLGRYPLHLHHGMDTADGLIVEGCVVRHSGNHAFVSHATHGVTFRDCVAVGFTDGAFWWDPIKGTGSTMDASNRIHYQNCFAGDGDAPLNDNLNPKNEWSAFSLVAGRASTVSGCVAAAIRGPGSTAGYGWPPNEEIEAWGFDNNVAHNIPKNGLWIWQNANFVPHEVTNFTAYLCGDAGINDGAYRNRYSFTGGVLVGNKHGVVLHAAPKLPDAFFKCITERASTTAGVGVANTNAAPPIDLMPFIDCDFETPPVKIGGQLEVNQRIEFVTGDGCGE